MKNKPLKLIELTWNDHWSPPGNWLSSQDITESLKYIPVMKTTGYLIAETDCVYSIASTISDCGLIAQVMNILKSDVVSKRILK